MTDVTVPEDKAVKTPVITMFFLDVQEDRGRYYHIMKREMGIKKPQIEHLQLKNTAPKMKNIQARITSRIRHCRRKD